MVKSQGKIKEGNKIKELIEVLKKRFEQNMSRHPHLDWSKIEAKLLASPKSLKTLSKMEATGGEPDVVLFDEPAGTYTFCDCSIESPSGRRNICYDQAALMNRIKNKPQNSAINMASQIGIELLNEKEYLYLQSLGDFDLKTSSWIKTPSEIRSLGGALFGDKRYNQSFIYHNGAESYYGSRGFRGSFKV